MLCQELSEQLLVTLTPRYLALCTNCKIFPFIVSFCKPLGEGDSRDMSSAYAIFFFIAFIHPIQWTIANPVSADRPAKRQKKSSFKSA